MMEFVPATAAQINYIELLSNKLQFSRKQRNAHIISIVGTRWKNDVLALSKAEATQVINKFKEWWEGK